jgi:hypothetical protein
MVAARRTAQRRLSYSDGPIRHWKSADFETLPNGKRVLIAGTKRGHVFALDPDDRGKLLYVSSHQQERRLRQRRLEADAVVVAAACLGRIRG